MKCVGMHFHVVDRNQYLSFLFTWMCTQSVFSGVYLQSDSFQPSSPNRVGGVGMHSDFSTMDDPMSQMMRGPPMGVRDVVINRPTSEKSFGFVLQSNTKRQGCSICEKMKSTE